MPIVLTFAMALPGARNPPGVLGTRPAAISRFCCCASTIGCINPCRKSDHWGDETALWQLRLSPDQIDPGGFTSRRIHLTSIGTAKNLRARYDLTQRDERVAASAQLNLAAVDRSPAKRQAGNLVSTRRIQKDIPAGMARSLKSYFG